MATKQVIILKKFDKTRLITWALLLLLIILTLFNSYTTYVQRNEIFKEEKSFIIEQVKQNMSLITPLKGVDGITPIKGVDYTDGKDGTKGDKGDKGDQGLPGMNGTDGKTPIKGVDYTDGKDGVDGKTPLIRCNVNKNRWEIRYSEDDNWSILNGKAVKCTIEEDK